MAPEPRNQTVSFDKIAALKQCKENLALSYTHIAKQEGIIRRLTSEGHMAMADQAVEVLATMNGHVKVEVDMVARLEAEIRSQ